MEIGDKVEEALQRREQVTRERSKELDKKPVLEWNEQLIWEVFSILHTSRPIGMQASGIPILDIVALQPATTESVMDLVRIVKAVDNRWLDWIESKGNK